MKREITFSEHLFEPFDSGIAEYEVFNRELPKNVVKLCSVTIKTDKQEIKPEDKLYLFGNGFVWQPASPHDWNNAVLKVSLIFKADSRAVLDQINRNDFTRDGHLGTPIRTNKLKF